MQAQLLLLGGLLLAQLCGHTGHGARINSAVARMSSSWCMRIHPTVFQNQSFSPEEAATTVKCFVNGARDKDHSWFVDWKDLAGDLQPAAEAIVAPATGPLLQELVQCMNGAHSGKLVTYDDIVTGKLADVKVVAAWWNTEKQSSLPATIVTVTTFERLHQLRPQCLAWNGPLSVVVHYALYQKEEGPLTDENRDELRRAVLRVLSFAADMEMQPKACELNLLLVYEVASDPRVLPVYPVNKLRNLARIQARTPMTATLDVDLLPSRSLVTRLSTNKISNQMLRQMTNGKWVYVLPAFELAPEYDTVAWADTLVSAPNKAVVARLMHIPAVMQFQARTFKHGHQVTDYSKWHSATQDYPVAYQPMYEPWVLGMRESLPWTDERYRGYGKNKIQAVSHINNTGYQFMVMHDSYVIHRPHSRSAAQARFFEVRYNLTQKAGDYTALHDLVEGLYKEQVSRQEAGEHWEPSISAQSLRCQAELSWW